MLLGVIAIVWTMLTFYVQREGPEAMSSIGESVNNPKALIVYDPDPFYDLDEQVCTSFALGLAEEGWSSKVVSVASTKDLGKETYDLYVFCANTYNWAPDRSVSNYIKDHQNLKEKKTVAITLGSGSTERSKRILEELIKQKEASLMASKTFWLMRLNDESRIKESNIKVAVETANAFGKQIAQRMENEKDNNPYGKPRH